MPTVKNRDWKKYNEHLVKRGEFYINPSFLDTWLRELEEMNSGKVGQPYVYPKSMIEFLAVLHCKGYSYRELEGILRGLSKRFVKFPVISYSQICRRFNRLNVRFETNEKDLVVAGDGSGYKVSNRGEWMRQKWKVRRGWVKVVLLGSTDGNVVDVRVGNEKLDERASVRGMIRKNQSRITKVLLDGYHDCRATFNLCDKYGIETAIRIRKNANTRARGSPRRKREVRLYKNLGHKKWVKTKGYGMRWVGSEGIFSGSKRIFGEHVSATKKRNMYHEVKIKFWAYHKLIGVT